VRILRKKVKNSAFRVIFGKIDTRIGQESLELPLSGWRLDMLVRRCYQQLDEPLVVFMGLQFGEVVIVLGAGFGTALVGFAVFGVGVLGILGLFGALGTSLAIAKLLRRLRKGTPAYPLTRLYRYRLLPPFLRPRYLIPLDGGREAGSKVRWSPVEGNDDQDRKARIAYFGR
jgi:hypothetical protein